MGRIFTLLGAIAATVGAWLAALATRDTAKIAQSVGEAQTRAYISVDEAIYQIRGDSFAPSPASW